MLTYFDHDYISASDLKAFLKKTQGGIEEPANLQAIFDFGTLFHETILEPFKHYDHEETDELKLARKMKDTFFKDELCRMIVMRPDFQREQEHYEVIEVGGMKYEARCKCDGDSKGISTILELKGLIVTTQKAFDAAIDRLNYDMTAVHYMLTAKRDRQLIIGISKKNPDLLFKRVIKKHDETYLIGEEKLIQTLRLLREYSPEDIQLVA